LVMRLRRNKSLRERTMTKLFSHRGWSPFITIAMVSAFAIGLMPVGAGGDNHEKAREEQRTVTVSVSASDSAGNPLRYRWRSTDGHIIDQDAPSTAWTLPAGPGIHFAYVLVSNSKGGYTERRIAVNTDSLRSAHRRHPRPMDLIPPPAPASSGVPFRDWLGGGHTLKAGSF